MSTLPIDWEDKVNNPQLLAFLQQFGNETYLSAEEINQLRDAVNELYLNNLVSEIIATNGLSLVGQNLTFNADWLWAITGTTYTNPANIVRTIPFTAPGKKRIDLFVLNTQNSVDRIPGPESIGTPVAPVKPANTLQATFVTVTDGTIGEPSLPILGDLYRTKEEKQEILVDQDDSFNTLLISGKLSYRLIGTMTEIIGIQDVQNSPLYWGEEITIFNDQANPVDLKHLVTAADVFSLSLPNDSDLTLQPKEMCKIKFTKYGHVYELESTNKQSESVKDNFFISLNGFIQFTQAPTTWYSRSIGPQNIYWNNTTFATGFTPSTNFDARVTAITFPFDCKIKNAVVRVNHNNGNGKIINIKGYVFTPTPGSSIPSNIREVFSLTWSTVTGPRILIENTDFTVDSLISISKNESFQLVVNQSNDIPGIAMNIDMSFEFEKL